MTTHTLTKPDADQLDPSVDTAAVEAFTERMCEIVNGAGLAMMISIGHKTRLFDTMADLQPSTSEQIAWTAGLNERYVREWLNAMTTGRVVEYDPQTETYRLPRAHAACLTRAAAPANLAVTTQFIPVLASVEDQVVECFRNGGGVPYEAFAHFHDVMAEESDQTTLGGLTEHILPLIDGITKRLTDGIDVLDIGCGSGRAMNHLAAIYPASRFQGIDLTGEGILRARAEAERADLTNVRFEAADATNMDYRERFDLITAFDAIHDQARPDIVLANIRRALRPGGVFLMQDIAACSHVHENMDHPLAPYLYTISTMHCMTVSLAQGGMGLGTAWGRQTALKMLREAGFRDVRVTQLAHDELNDYYVARP